MAESAIEKAFADMERLQHGAKAANAGDIGRQLATSSNWESREWAKLGNHVEQYRHYHGWVYCAINAIAQRCAGQPIRLARPKRLSRRGLKAFDAKFGTKAFVDNLEPIDSHVFLDTIYAPNPVMVGHSLIFSTIASLELTGEAHWWLTEDEDTGLRQIWPMPSHWIFPADALRSQWTIRPWNCSSQEFTVPGTCVAYFNLPDPGDPFLARSPLSSQAHAVRTDESIQTAQDAAFKNGIMPKLAVTVGDPLDPNGGGGILSSRPLLDRDQRGAIISAILDRWGTPHNAGYPIILDALIKDVKKISNDPGEMDFLNSGKSTKSRIFQAFGVNPLIVGEIEGANRAQAVVAEQSFCSNVICPLLELLSQCLTRWVLPVFSGDDEGLVAWFEPARANDPEMTLSEWKFLVGSGVATVNECRQAFGLAPIDDGNTRLIPANLIEQGG